MGCVLSIFFCGGNFYYVRAFFVKTVGKLLGRELMMGWCFGCVLGVLNFFVERAIFFLLLKLKQELFENERLFETPCQHCLQTA